MGAGSCKVSLPNSAPAGLSSGEGSEGNRETFVLPDYMCNGVQIVPQSRLVVRATLRLQEGATMVVSALVDTGAELNLFRKGLIGERFLRRAEKPKTFVAANKEVMVGGSMEAPCDVVLFGRDMETGLEEEQAYPTVFYDADIGMDVILSYDWLRRANVDVRCRRHGLEANRPQGTLWVPGVKLSRPKGMAYLGTTGVDGSAPFCLEVREGSLNHQCEDYTVRWPVVWEIMHRLGVKPERDCFASQGNSRFSRFWTKGDDALNQTWAAGEVLWVNPPWRLWPRTAEKILEGTSEVVCVLPAWGKPWVQDLLRVASGRVYFERGNRLFEVEGKPSHNTQWGTWALWFKAGPRVM